MTAHAKNWLYRPDIFEQRLQKVTPKTRKKYRNRTNDRTSRLHPALLNLDEPEPK